MTEFSVCLEKFASKDKRTYNDFYEQGKTIIQSNNPWLTQDLLQQIQTTIEQNPLKGQKEFSYKRIHKAGAVFDIEKLNLIKKNKIMVNSAHHQAIDKLGKNLIINGLANDKIIESIEHISHRWCLGVQWHPERSGDVNSLAIPIGEGFLKYVLNYE